MTIKELETASGMTRANIRYYESEGLITPQRQDNGYRDYSEKDLETLQKIRLLRSLQVSLEEIHQLQNREKNLRQILDAHRATLGTEQKSIGRSAQVCEEICRAWESYETLNAQRYLDALAQPSEGEQVNAIRTVPEGELWSRFFARGLDMMLYTTICNVFLILVGNIDVSNAGNGLKLAVTFGAMALMILIEPWLLSAFGTTPGKWILGLKVHDGQGNRLSYDAALRRTGGVLLHGCGLEIPIYSQYRSWKSYRAIKEGEYLDWEEESIQEKRDRRGLGVLLYAGALGLMMAVLMAASYEAQMPKFRGDITAAQFCQNYRRLASYYDLDYDSVVLDDTGKWQKMLMGNDFVVGLFGEMDPPDFEITETDGKVSEISFRLNVDGMQNYPWSCLNQMELTTLAFAGGQKGFGSFSTARKELLEYISEHPYSTFERSVNGISVMCEVVYHGYADTGAGDYMRLIPEEEDCQYELYFRIYKE